MVLKLKMLMQGTILSMCLLSFPFPEQNSFFSHCFLINTYPTCQQAVTVRTKLWNTYVLCGQFPTGAGNYLAFLWYNQMHAWLTENGRLFFLSGCIPSLPERSRDSQFNYPGDCTLVISLRYQFQFSSGTAFPCLSWSFVSFVTYLI